MNFLKVILIITGTLSLTAGIIGIIIPGLPTTPFLLLTAGLYVRSSDKLYNMLIHNRYVGSYISEFRAKKGMAVKEKLYVIILMWIMILFSCYFLISATAVRLVVLVTGLTGTIVMGFIVPTISSNNEH